MCGEPGRLRYRWPETPRHPLWTGRGGRSGALRYALERIHSIVQAAVQSPIHRPTSSSTATSRSRRDGTVLRSTSSATVTRQTVIPASTRTAGRSVQTPPKPVDVLTANTACLPFSPNRGAYPRSPAGRPPDPAWWTGAASRGQRDCRGAGTRRHRKICCHARKQKKPTTWGSGGGSTVSVMAGADVGVSYLAISSSPSRHATTGPAGDLPVGRFTDATATCDSGRGW